MGSPPRTKLRPLSVVSHPLRPALCNKNECALQVAHSNDYYNSPRETENLRLSCLTIFQTDIPTTEILQRLY